ncbi:MAG: hypothetical protein AAF721_22870 [Myxococcota bacterium]
MTTSCYGAALGIMLTGLAASGCPATTNDAAETEAAATTSEGDTAMTATPDPVDTTTSGADEEGTDTASTDTAGTDSGGFLDRPDLGGNAGVALGELCGSSEDCESEFCFMFPGSSMGVCSECEVDADCMRDGGPGTCTLTNGSPWGVCGDGSAGSLCQSDAGCAEGLICTAAFPGTPFLQCGVCGDEAPCDGEQLCVAQLGLGTGCVDPGTVENDAFCTGPDDGACASGHCTEALSQGNPAGLFYC